MVTTRLIAASALVLAASIASAQSLGDVAKKEEARRKDVKAPAKVYTNGDLHADTTSAAPSRPATQAGSIGTEQGSSSSPAAQQPSDARPAADEQKKDEAYWKGRLEKARGDRDRAQTFSEALQSRINALTADFSARSDPAQRAVIGSDRQKALDELDRVKKEIEASTKAIANIQEEARRAGVPAGWVR